MPSHHRPGLNHTASAARARGRPPRWVTPISAVPSILDARTGPPEPPPFLPPAPPAVVCETPAFVKQLETGLRVLAVRGVQSKEGPALLASPSSVSAQGPPFLLNSDGQRQTVQSLLPAALSSGYVRFACKSPSMPMPPPTAVSSHTWLFPL